MKRWLIIGGIGIIIVLIVFFFLKGDFQERRVVLEIEGPESVIAGEEIEYKVKIENKNEVALQNAKLSFFYSAGSIAFNEEGKPQTSLVIVSDIGEIKRSEKKEFSFKGITTGERGEIKKTKAALSYTPSSIRSAFEKTAEFSSTISRLGIPMTLIGPLNVLSGQRVEVILDFRNESGSDLENLQVDFSYPDGFEFIEATPSAGEGNNVFSVPLLKINEAKRIVIEGNLKGFENESKRFTASLEKQIDDKFFDFQKAQTSLVISTPLLTTDISVNEQESVIVHAGDKLVYKISFSNNSNHNFSALELKAVLTGQMFDFPTINTNGFFDQNSKTILWNAAVEPLLSNLGPNQKGDVSFEVRVKNDFPKTFGAKDFSLKVTALLETQSVPPDFNLDKISASSELLSKVGGKATFTSQAFYSDSVFPNSGPIPPRVGSKTTYTIHWKIVNEGSDLTNVRISSFLLPGIAWQDKFKVTPRQSDLSFNSRTGQVVWEITTIPAGTGVVSPAFEAVFQIGLTPASNQIGQAVELLKETTLEATDNFTKDSVELSQAKITTQTIVDSPGVIQQ